MVFQGTQFYHSLLRKYVVVFGNFFSDLYIKRQLADGTTVSEFKVPLQYSAKEKMFVRLNSDPDADRPYSALLPVISFELAPGNALVYDADRKTNTIVRNVKRNPNDKNKFRVMYNPVPYNINFMVHIYAKNTEDGNKILEQILPFFTPEWTVTMELIPDMVESKDIPVELHGVTLQDMYDGDFKQRRFFVWSLNFTMRGWFYGPQRNKPMIKFSTVNNLIAGSGTSNSAGDANTTSSTNYMLQNKDTQLGPIDFSANSTDRVEYTTTQPGLTGDGQPTTNVAASIDWHTIDVNDDWGYAIESNTQIVAS